MCVNPKFLFFTNIIHKRTLYFITKFVLCAFLEPERRNQNAFVCVSLAILFLYIQINSWRGVGINISCWSPQEPPQPKKQIKSSVIIMADQFLWFNTEIITKLRRKGDNRLNTEPLKCAAWIKDLNLITRLDGSRIIIISLRLCMCVYIFSLSRPFSQRLCRLRHSSRLPLPNLSRPLNQYFTSPIKYSPKISFYAGSQRVRWH